MDEKPVNKGNQTLGWIAAGLLGIFVVVSFINGGDVTAEEKPATLTQKIPECKKVLAGHLGKGLVVKIPSDNRVDVDELTWAPLMADEKRALMGIVACAAFGRQPADLRFADHVVVYGARSGKRLAMLTSAGFHFE